MSQSPAATAVPESLVALPPEQWASLVGFVPDTPWTTGPLHVLARRQGKVYVDSPVQPRNMVIVANGDPATRTLDRAFLFGAPTADGLVHYVESLKGPTEIVCDDDVAELVRKHHAGATAKQSIVHWFDRVETAQTIASEAGVKRLRISDADTVAALLPGWALRTFRTPKEMVTGGSAFIVEQEGALAGVSHTVDLSSKHERISVAVVESARGKGLGAALARRLARSVSDAARIPVAIVDRTDAAGLRVAEKVGFDRRALMRSWVTRLRSL